MPGRSKRAAAVIAESRIKKVTEEYINEEKQDISLRRTTGASRKKRKRKSSDVFEFDGVVSRVKHTRGKSRPNLNSQRYVTHDDNQRSMCDRDNLPYHSSAHLFRKDMPTSSWPAACSGPNDLRQFLFSSGSSVRSSITSTATLAARNPIILEFSTEEKAHMERQQRRFRRSINSTGSMFLSYRTSSRMSMSQSSPGCSPILGTRLEFTPVAHLPTTPTRWKIDTRCMAVYRNLNSVFER